MMACRTIDIHKINTVLLLKYFRYYPFIFIKFEYLLNRMCLLFKTQKKYFQ